MDEFQFKIDEQVKKFEDMQELVDGIQSKVDEQVKKFEEFQVLMDAFQSKVDEHDKKFEEMQVLMDAFQSKVDEHEKKIMDMQIALDLLIEVELVALKKKDDEIMMKNYSQDLQMKGNFEVLSNELYLLKTQLAKLQATVDKNHPVLY
jgi:predicted nuclease with TOPRIM domain